MVCPPWKCVPLQIMPISSSEKRKEKGRKPSKSPRGTDFDDEISGFGNRYARKAKINGKAAVTELVHHRPSLGVHTRAKTTHSAPPGVHRTASATSSPAARSTPFPLRESGSYREQPNDPNPKSNPSPAPVATRSPNRVNQAAGRGECPVNSDSVGSVPTKSNCFKKTKATAVAVREASPEVNAAETGSSFGENVLELDSSRDN
ncbi:cyclin-dependent kinase inhibitor [Musa troglodytarum]|uniref:Cyclin-dependent kinase inhibitor n=1 Tax=Musa troglodytarum TaxID=320322 RepID=A0A9E7GBK4_9LILI|nr:cyclin-dependent kinase inhibitor [Musa troglodytarum]